MKKRWKDRIQVLLANEKTYDAWGHLINGTCQSAGGIWADVCPILGKTPAAYVTVRMPFDYTENIHIGWQDQQWKITQGPTCFPATQLAQFKIEL